MDFAVSAEAYDRFMGRFSEPLAAQFVHLLDPRPDDRVLDVGCGPGALTTALTARVGAERVAAVDPTPTFVAALRDRCPGVDVRVGSAEQLPWPTASFDLTVAQLVVHFMTDQVAGLSEMARVTRPGGRVAASVWDHAASRGPLSYFWRAVADLHPGTRGDTPRPGSQEGELARFCVAAGFEEVAESELTVVLSFDDFDDWWHPFTLGVGPVGAFVARLSDEERNRLRDRFAELLPPPPFEISATAWVVTAVVPGRA